MFVCSNLSQKSYAGCQAYMQLTACFERQVSLCHLIQSHFVSVKQPQAHACLERDMYQCSHTHTHTHTHTPSSWELSCHCLPGSWPVERESYLSFCSAHGSHLNTASVVSFSQHDDGEGGTEEMRERGEGEQEREREKQMQIIKGRLINSAISPFRHLSLCFPSSVEPCTQNTPPLHGITTWYFGQLLYHVLLCHLLSLGQKMDYKSERLLNIDSKNMWTLHILVYGQIFTSFGEKFSYEHTNINITQTCQSTPKLQAGCLQVDKSNVRLFKTFLRSLLISQ